MELISTIFDTIDNNPADITAYRDLFSICRSTEGDDFKAAHANNAKLRTKVTHAIAHAPDVEEFFDLYKKTLLFDAPYYFDSYMLYLEIFTCCRPKETPWLLSFASTTAIGVLLLM